MDEQNINHQNRDTIRTDESVVSGQVEKIKKLFKVLAVLVVFFSSLSLPIYIAHKTEMRAKEMRVKMDMGQLKNWTTIYLINNNSYKGLDKDSEINRVFNDIEAMGGNVDIWVSKDTRRYCCQANFSNKEFESWCVDYTGNVRNDKKCDLNNIQCK